MSAVRPALRPSRRVSTLAGLIGLAAVIGLALVGLFAPAVVLRGWLVGFSVAGGLGLGCVAWLAIHGLTGGRFGDMARPALLGGALALPLSILLMVPILLAAPWLYPWAADPDAAGPGVAAVYLNVAGVGVRSLALLGALGVVGFYARRGPLSPLAAGIALIAYAVLMTFASFDWLLSLDPRFTSSAIGMQIVASQLLEALCVVVLATDAAADDPAWADFGGLMLATAMGVGYLILMTGVIHWYGDKPEQAAWYLRRMEGGWWLLEAAGTLLGAVGIGALLFSALRRGRGPLRAIAALLLLAVVAEMVWLVAPDGAPGSGWAVLTGAAATLACGGLVLGLASRLPPAEDKGRADGR